MPGRRVLEEDLLMARPRMAALDSWPHSEGRQWAARVAHDQPGAYTEPRSLKADATAPIVNAPTLAPCGSPARPTPSMPSSKNRSRTVGARGSARTRRIRSLSLRANRCGVSQIRMGDIAGSSGPRTSLTGVAAEILGNTDGRVFGVAQPRTDGRARLRDPRAVFGDLDAPVTRATPVGRGGVRGRRLGPRRGSRC